MMQPGFSNRNVRWGNNSQLLLKGKKSKRALTAADEDSSEPRPANFMLIRRWVAILSTIAAIVQVIIARDVDNLAAITMAYIGTIFTAYYFFKPKNLKFFPLSSWMVLFFVLANLTVPLIVKCFEAEPLDYKLQFTTTTFGYSLATSICAIAAHWFYTHSKALQAYRSRLTQSILRPMGLFQSPKEYQLWLMGFIGCLAHAVMVATPDINESQSFFVKACVSIVPFTYAPFLIPFSFLISDTPRKTKTGPLISVYFIFTVVIALAANGRIGIVLPVVTAAMCWVMAYFTNRLPNSYRRTRVLAIALIALVALIPIFSNMALAMSAARREKEGAGPLKLIQLSISYYGDQKVLSQVILDSQSDEAWDEIYVHNPVLSRFVNTKFHDLGFTDTHNLTNSDRAQYIDYLKDKMLGLLPAPVLNKLGVDLDKADRLAGSAPDFLHYLNTGSGLTGKRTGSVISSGVFLFGVLFLPVFMLASTIMYASTDAFCIVRKRRIDVSQVGKEAVKTTSDIFFSPAILVMIWQALYINYQTELADWVAVLIRNFPIQVVFYWLIIRLSNSTSFATLFSTKTRSVQRV